MKLETKKEVLNDLWDIMGQLYRARYKATGPYIDTKGKPGCYSEMCHDTFNDIAGLQTTLQRTISRLEEEIKAEENPPTLSDKLKEEMCHGRSCQCNGLQADNGPVGGILPLCSSGGGEERNQDSNQP